MLENIELKYNCKISKKNNIKLCLEVFKGSCTLRHTKMLEKHLKNILIIFIFPHTLNSWIDEK